MSHSRRGDAASAASSVCIVASGIDGKRFNPDAGSIAADRTDGLCLASYRRSVWQLHQSMRVVMPNQFLADLPQGTLYLFFEKSPEQLCSGLTVVARQRSLEDWCGRVVGNGA